MILVLQTNIPGSLHLWLYQSTGKLKQSKTVAIMYHGSEKLLAAVDSLLRDAHSTPQHLEGILVVRGPGPFSAVRTGIVVANTMSWMLDIPVAGLVSRHPLDEKRLNQAILGHKSWKKNILMRPWYGKSPNITKPKLRR